MLLVAAIMAAGTAAALIFPEQIFSIFIDDAALIGPGSTALRIICLGFLVSSVSVVYAGVFEALGCGKKSLLISLIRQIIIIIPLGFILSRIWGPVGIWVCFPIAEFLAAGTARFMVKKQNI
jgi:Na+-driven multidrug efflux pump